MVSLEPHQRAVGRYHTYLTKPFRTQTILEVVQVHLGGVDGRRNQRTTSLASDGSLPRGKSKINQEREV